jgi:hypothetical protein
LQHGGPLTKCPSCGKENFEQAKFCRLCGRSLPTQRENTISRAKSDVRGGLTQKEGADSKKYTPPSSLDYRTIPEKIKFDYAHGIRDPTQRILEGIQTLLTRFQDQHLDVDKLLTEAAEFIQRQFGIDNVAIGLKDPKDGLFKYRAMAGFRDDAIEAHKKIAYKKEQFFEDDQFHGVIISKYSRIYMAEDNELTEAERNAYNRPALLTMKRKDSTDSLEGDYIDTGIYGRGDELVGWIEISGTRSMKLPDIVTIRGVETIASIIAAAIMFTKAH